MNVPEDSVQDGRVNPPVSKAAVSGDHSISAPQDQQAETPAKTFNETQALIAYLRTFVESESSLIDLKHDVTEILDVVDTITGWIKGPREHTVNGNLASTRIKGYLDLLKSVLYGTRSSPQRMGVLRTWISGAAETLRARSSATKELSNKKADKLCQDIAEDVVRVEYEGTLILEMFGDKSQQSPEALAVKGDNISLRSSRAPQL